MVIGRSGNSFIYVLEEENCYTMFSHEHGSSQGGQKQLSKDEKNTAIVSNVANVASSLYTAKFDKDLNVIRVMASVEEAILESFPAEGDSDQDYEFFIPGEGLK